ncbi:hypothetical protein [Methylobacterium sp. JK268]
MDAPSAPTIQQQIDEVECCLLSMEAAVSAWERAPEKRRAVETGCCRSKLVPLRAAVRTLKTVRDNADEFRAALQAKRRGT